MVYAMSGARSVELKRNVYVGGGHADSDSKNCTVQVYDLDSGKWSTLPKYQCSVLL